MNNIPTAEEFIGKYSTWSVQDSPDTMTTVIDKQDCLDAMKQFTQHHVDTALKAAAENAKLIDLHDRTKWKMVEGHIVDKQSILNAYPKENIK